MRLFAVSNQLLQASAKRSLQTSAIARKSVAERAAETKAAAEKMKKLQEAFQVINIYLTKINCF